MAGPSRLREQIRLPLVISVHPYLKDHHFEGKIILPAVEILQQLAGSVLSYLPVAQIRGMRRASFDRFLIIDGNSHVVEAFNELEVLESGRISSKLITEAFVKRTSMIRTKVHAVVDFTVVDDHVSGLSTDVMPAPDATLYRISSRKLYSDLVPFGPSYQNVKGDIYLSESGAVAQVYAADHPAPSEPLGSPFPLDGALHIACAWGQRFHHIVAFPVGFEERLLINPTLPGETYNCRILPVSATGKSLQFDIWIHDQMGVLCEKITGVVMRDVFGGRFKPPKWVLSATPPSRGLGEILS